MPIRTPQHICEEVVRAYLGGKSLHGTAAALGISYTAVRNALVEAGVPRRKSGNPVAHHREWQQERARPLRELGWLCIPPEDTHLWQCSDTPTPEEAPR